MVPSSVETRSPRAKPIYAHANGDVVGLGSSDAAHRDVMSSADAAPMPPW